MLEVGPPGVGKSVAINPASEILRRSQTCHIAPTDVSKQGLLDVLITAGKGKIDPVSGEPFDYHFMAICISELSNFMPQYDVALAGLLTDIFDCPPILDEKKRGVAGDPKVIPFPGLSFIMGTATQNLGTTVHDEMWGSGFMARVILVYSAEAIKPPSAAQMFAPVDKREAQSDFLAESLRKIGELTGPMAWTTEAQESLWHFWTADTTAPLHNRLAHYNTRRWMHLAKLMMISALSWRRMEVTQFDFLVALDWLLDAESFMPEIFKGMTSHEDGKIYDEMYVFVFTIFKKDRIAVTAEALWGFMSQRVDSYSIARMIEVAETAGYICRVAGTNGDTALYVPGKNPGQHMPGVI